MSQEDLAERSNLHRTYISDVERGVRNPSLKIIIQLAQALKVSLSALFSEDLSPGINHNDQPGVKSIDILLVTVDPPTVDMTLQVLKKARFANHVHFVSDGTEALDFLFSREKYTQPPPAGNPHLILLDLSLPGMSGLEVLRRLKADSRTTKIPVVMLTCCSANADIAECERLGAITYITKPVNWLGLGAAMEKLNLDWVLRQSPGAFCLPARP